MGAGGRRCQKPSSRHHAWTGFVRGRDEVLAFHLPATFDKPKNRCTIGRFRAPTTRRRGRPQRRYHRIRARPCWPASIMATSASTLSPRRLVIRANHCYHRGTGLNPIAGVHQNTHVRVTPENDVDL